MSINRKGNVFWFGNVFYWKKKFKKISQSDIEKAEIFKSEYLNLSINFTVKSEKTKEI